MKFLFDNLYQLPLLKELNISSIFINIENVKKEEINDIIIQTNHTYKDLLIII